MTALCVPKKELPRQCQAQKKEQTTAALVSEKKAINKDPLQINRTAKPGERKKQLLRANILLSCLLPSLPQITQSPNSCTPKVKVWSLGNPGRHSGQSELCCFGGSYRNRQIAHVKTIVRKQLQYKERQLILSPLYAMKKMHTTTRMLLRLQSTAGCWILLPWGFKVIKKDKQSSAITTYNKSLLDSIMAPQQQNKAKKSLLQS